jgi:glycosyltransferase involved in cell wall biosynthesis
MRPDSRARARLRKQWGYEQNEVLLGMVARFDPHKDHDNLFKALAILKQIRPEWICLLAGHGMTADNPELASLIRTLGLEHDVLLKGERHDIPDLMNALDIHVLSSVSEGFPNVIAEAMACGTPCVATDAGDASLIVGTTGWIVPPRNPIKLAHALEVAMLAHDTPNAWKKRQVACRRRIEKKFPITGMVTAYNRAWAL